VLLVDDDPAVRGVVAKFLAFDGHRVQATAGGAEALRHLEAEPYELLVADRAMPGMTGDELAAAVATASPETAVLLLSGFGDLMLAAGEHPPGVDVVAGKPIDLVGLRRAVASALAARDVRRAEAVSSPS
jgi:DNA-binding NtrC family response regulator